MGYSLKVSFDNAPPITIPIAYGDVYFDTELNMDCLKVTKDEILSAFSAVNYILYPTPFSGNYITTAPSYWGTTYSGYPNGYVDYMYAGNMSYPFKISLTNNFGAKFVTTKSSATFTSTDLNDINIYNGGGTTTAMFNFMGFRANYKGEDIIIFWSIYGNEAAYDFEKEERLRFPVEGMPLYGRQIGKLSGDITQSIKVGIYNSGENRIQEWATYTIDPVRAASLVTDCRIPLGTDRFNYSKQFFNGSQIPDPDPEPSTDNPYAPGGTSGTGGGKGRFDASSDPVDFPGLPTLSASRCGLITMFNPSVPELQQLSTKMWSKDFFDNVTKLISNPIDIIVALTIVPVSPPVSGREEVIAGLLSTGVSMNVVSSQYMSFSCGTYTVENFYDAALDYAPYTKASIYLPYIGVRQLNVDEIMGATLEIKYNIDLFTGACVAMIKVNNAVLYSFDGNIATQIPVNAANYASLYSSLIQGVASIATTAVTGGATAPSLAAQAASFAVNAVTSSKPTIQRAGGITGSNGLMAIQTPFLIFEIPRQSLPDNQQVYTGYPSNITYKLADLSGFTQVSDIHLDGIPATSEELTEIERLLKEGVII